MLGAACTPRAARPGGRRQAAGPRRRAQTGLVAGDGLPARLGLLGGRLPGVLGFQVQALAGEVQAGDDGEFSVRFFVNVGESSQAGHRVYIGGESVVTLKNLRIFLASLHEAIAAWPRTQGVSPV